MFEQGTEPGGQDLQPAVDSVIMPGLNYGYAVFKTYTIDVRSDPSDAGTSIGTASVITQLDDNNNRYLTDNSGLLSFAYSESYSNQLVTVNLPSWGWNNDAPYDIEFTAVSGTNASPAVGTVIASGERLTVTGGRDGKPEHVRAKLPRHSCGQWIGSGRNKKATAPDAQGLVHVGKPMEPPPISPARGPPTEWTELVQAHDDHDVMQASHTELPVIDIHSL